ncbi:phage/plasmid primase, P4 family [Cesiribacter sp. SM1]|uniref:DNA primase family protein n=1 Tax=Cesiribacter sp. SM1 TaxID=2861196 RepID=UPI001CD7B787|nr:phage/plasmid primase, P4 family [Cesiribacter sp. SM1]
MNHHIHAPINSSGSPTKDNKIQPNFEASDKMLEQLRSLADLAGKDQPTRHEELLETLLQQIEPIDFRDVAGLGEEDKITRKHYQVITIEQILKLAAKSSWGLCRHNEAVYLYNGCYWSMIEEELLKSFLGKAGEKMGMDKFQARHYMEKDALVKQFFASAYLPAPLISDGKVLVNLQNGTYEITAEGNKLRPFAAADFLIYQLPFAYNSSAKAPKFQAYMDQVLPDKALQDILAEFLGYVFIPTGVLKLEKVLLLYGSGANGKSVFFEIVSALLGDENISSYSLQSLTNDNGYFRAKLANKLVNYASEINGKLETSIFKQLASGEPVEARLPYGQPFMLTRYAKLVFNCNELPKEVEHTNAFYRRFLIIPFEATIPEAEQDKDLAKKIIEDELSGVFNWALKGLQRLLTNKTFTHSDVVVRQLADYRKQGDSVQMFLEEQQYVKSSSSYTLIKGLYAEYRQYCVEDGYHPVSKVNFRKRLESAGISVNKHNVGNVAYLEIARNK